MAIYFLPGPWSQKPENKINKIFFFYLFYLFYFKASVTKDLGENKWPFILFILFIFSGS